MCETFVATLGPPAGSGDQIGGAEGNDVAGGPGNDIIGSVSGRDLIDGGPGGPASYGLLDKPVALNGSAPSVVKIGGVAEDTLIDIENVNGGIKSDSLRGDRTRTSSRAVRATDARSTAIRREPPTD